MLEFEAQNKTAGGTRWVEQYLWVAGGWGEVGIVDISDQDGIKCHV